jgi:hypothetical protein
MNRALAHGFVCDQHHGSLGKFTKLIFDYLLSTAVYQTTNLPTQMPNRIRSQHLSSHCFFSAGYCCQYVNTECSGKFVWKGLPQWSDRMCMFRILEPKSSLERRVNCKQVSSFVCPNSKNRKQTCGLTRQHRALLACFRPRNQINSPYSFARSKASQHQTLQIIMIPAKSPRIYRTLSNDVESQIVRIPETVHVVQ